MALWYYWLTRATVRLRVAKELKNNTFALRPAESSSIISDSLTSQTLVKEKERGEEEERARERESPGEREIESVCVPQWLTLSSPCVELHMFTRSIVLRTSIIGLQVLLQPRPTNTFWPCTMNSCCCVPLCLFLLFSAVLWFRLFHTLINSLVTGNTCYTGSRGWFWTSLQVDLVVDLPYGWQFCRESLIFNYIIRKHILVLIQ